MARTYHPQRSVADFSAFRSPFEPVLTLCAILSDLRVGIGHHTVLSVLHPDALGYYNKCSNIRAVCQRLWNPFETLPELELQVVVGRPFKPQLAYRNQKR